MDSYLLESDLVFERLYASIVLKSRIISFYTDALFLLLVVVFLNCYQSFVLGSIISSNGRSHAHLIMRLVHRSQADVQVQPYLQSTLTSVFLISEPTCCYDACD